MEERSLDTNEDGCSIVGAEKKSPGRRRVVPYTISADVHDRSSLRVARIPRRIIGRSSTQLLPARPFACGWYAVMRSCVVPKRFMRECQRSHSNCYPRSEVIVVGTPKREIQPVRRAEAKDSAVASTIGIASGQRVYRSMQVSR